MPESATSHPAVERWLARWSLAPDGPLHESWSSRVLPVRLRCGPGPGEPAVLKVLKPHSDETDAAALLRWYDGRGAVRLLRAEAEALLLERAGGRRSLAALAAEGGDLEAAAVLADAAAGLQAPRPAPPPPLPSLAQRFAALLEARPEGRLLERCAETARRLLAEPTGAAVLHGDLHHDNLLDGDARGWLAIDPIGVVGEPAFDLANLFCNPWRQHALVLDRARMARLAGFLSGRLGLERRRVLGFAFAHAGLAACWDVQDGEDPAFHLACAELLETLLD